MEIEIPTGQAIRTRQVVQTRQVVRTQQAVHHLVVKTDKNNEGQYHKIVFMSRENLVFFVKIRYNKDK